MTLIEADFWQLPFKGLEKELTMKMSSGVKMISWNVTEYTCG